MKKIIAMVLTVAMTVSSFGFIPSSYAAEDTKGPEIDLNSMKINKQTITDPYEMPTVKVKVTDQSEIESVSLFYYMDQVNVASAMLEYNASTGYFEGSVVYEGRDYDGDENIPMAYYGDYKLSYISAADAYENFTSIENADFPNMNFSVIGGNVNDDVAPKIDVDQLKIEHTAEMGNKAIVTIPIADDSKILYGGVSCRNKNGDSAGSFIKKKSDGVYQSEIELGTKGKYQIENIYIMDANHNRTCIINGDCIFYSEGTYEGEVKSLGHLDFQYGEGGPTELKTSVKSMTLSNAIIERNAMTETLTVTFDASAPLDVVYASYNSKNTAASPIGKKIDDYTFQFELPSMYYGLWRLTCLAVTDIYGNRVDLFALDEEMWTEGVQTDLSDGDYHVGIIDPETGLGVSDAEFDKTTKLEVDEESVDSDLGQDMVAEDAIGVGMYDVEVKGKRDDETALSIVAPEGFRDGDKVEVVHKRHDGTNETFEAEVKHGRITVETDEFSPFLIQVDKDHEHRYSAKKIVKKATLTKSGSYKEKCYACDATGKTKKLKPAKASLSKDSFSYTGNNINTKKLPKVVVKDSDGKIVSSENYTVTKPKNVKKMKAIGRYPYKITFKKTCEAFTGSKTIYLEITPPKTYVASLKAAKKAITVKWKKGKKAQVTGYQVMVATNSQFTKNKKTATVKGYSNVSKKITKLKAKTKYYVKVRTYKTVKGVKIYSDWSKTKTVKTK